MYRSLCFVVQLPEWLDPEEKDLHTVTAGHNIWTLEQLWAIQCRCVGNNLEIADQGDFSMSAQGWDEEPRGTSSSQFEGSTEHGMYITSGLPGQISRESGFQRLAPASTSSASGLLPVTGCDMWRLTTVWLRLLHTLIPDSFLRLPRRIDKCWVSLWLTVKIPHIWSQWNASWLS